MPPRISVLGACNVDFTFRAPRLPLLGETLPGSSFFFDYGGKGANQAVTVVRLGASVTLISRVGADEFGSRTRAQLGREGIDVEHVRATPGAQTGSAAIMVDDAGGNAIIGIPGANALVSADDVLAARKQIASSSAVLATLEVPEEAILTALAEARRAGAVTILNPAPVFSISFQTLALVDYLIPNEIELGLLTGMPRSNFDEIAAAANVLRNHGAQNVIVTLGERGALLVGGHDVQHVPAVPVQPVDVTGAGDTFIGSLAVFLAEGASLLDAIAKANRVAAITVTRMGAQAAIPRREEIGS